MTDIPDIEGRDVSPTTKDTGMDFSTYVRKPFTVQAVLITEDNIDEVAKDVGDIRYEDGVKYILVDRRLVRDVARVYVGFYMTRMGRNVRCYSKKAFHDQFIEPTTEMLEWVEFMNKGQ